MCEQRLTDTSPQLARVDEQFGKDRILRFDRHKPKDLFIAHCDSHMPPGRDLDIQSPQQLDFRRHERRADIG